MDACTPLRAKPDKGWPGNPYCGFKDDRYRFWALTIRCVCRTLTTIALGIVTTFATYSAQKPTSAPVPPEVVQSKAVSQNTAQFPFCKQC